jgi:hypothetical protein
MSLKSSSIPEDDTTVTLPSASAADRISAACRLLAASCAQQLRVHKLAVGLLALLFCGNTIVSFAMHAAHKQDAGSMAMPGFLVALFLALILTPWMRDFAIRKRMVDTTTSVRKIHVKAVPRIGGVAFVLAW